MAIGYTEVKVTSKKLNKLKVDQDLAKPAEKYGRFKAWLHYANLDSWQKQGHHFHYLTAVEGFIQRLICTCGVFVEDFENTNFDQISNEVAKKIGPHLLDRVQTVKGHRNLSNFKTPTCALIVDYVWKEKIGEYLWTAFCQECGELLTEVSNATAKSFTALHDTKCLVKS
jgi:hypothetical protein